MVTDAAAAEVVKVGLSPEIRRELAKNGLWAILFTLLLAFVLWTSWVREQAVMRHQLTIQQTQQQLVEEQRRLSEQNGRIEAKVDKLIDQR
jgi:uncharacterized protein HemX